MPVHLYYEPIPALASSFCPYLAFFLDPSNVIHDTAAWTASAFWICLLAKFNMIWKKNFFGNKLKVYRYDIIHYKDNLIIIRDLDAWVGL